MFDESTRFLIADDTKVIRSLLREVLGKIGFHDVQEAEDGSMALEMMKTSLKEKNPFQFIICDWNMPNLTGLDLLEARNADAYFSKVPFLMITIESERDYVLRAVALGVSDYIVKPFSESTLRAKLQSIWNRMRRS